MSDNDDGLCSRCDKVFDDDENALSCSECGCVYHLGDCSGVSESTFKSKGDSYKKAWRCYNCKPGKSRGSQVSRPKPELDVASLLADINRKLESLAPLKKTIDSIEKKVQEVSDKYDAVLKNQIRHETEIKELRKRMDTVENENPAPEVDRLRDEINDLEWQTRKLNLELHGVTMTENENLLEKVNNVATRLQVPPLTETEVVAVHRLPSRLDKVPTIIIRFARQSVRDQWLQNKKKLSGTKPDVFIAENMTKQNRALFWVAKDWAKTSEFRYVWHRNGSILVRKRDGEQAYVVKNEGDLSKLLV